MTPESHRPAESGDSPGEPSRRIVLPAMFTCLLALSILGCKPLYGPTEPPGPPIGARLFQEKCSKCHSTDVALKEYRSAEVWRDTIRRMRTEHQADLSQAEIELLVDYHVDRQQQEAAVFREKCQRCHSGKEFLEQPLSETEIRDVVRRMQEKAGNTISDEDVEVIIRYHAQAQRAKLEESFFGTTETVMQEQPLMERAKMLFKEKCDTCHRLSRALNYLNDPKVWEQTIARMQSYSNGTISTEQIDDLVDFHVRQQQKELNAFKNTCTRCHSEERINRRSMSEEEWFQTITRMQQKAPELISNEKVQLIAAYFHRRELALARTFYGKCRLCHTEQTTGASPLVSDSQLHILNASARTEFGEEVQISDQELLAVHVSRQRRIMQLYETKCLTCHPGGQGRGPGSSGRTRAEWISYIADRQGVELDKDVQQTINDQIEFHIAKHKH